MAFQKFLLNCALALIATVTFSTADNLKYDTAVNYNLQDYVVPLDYNVEIRYLLEDNILSALYSIIINITHPLKSIMLHSVPIKVIDAILIGDQYDFTTTIYKLNFSKHIRKEDILILHFNHLFHATFPAKYTLNMTYMRNIHENSLFRYTYLIESEVESRSQKFMKTGIEIMKARHLFPCRDDLAIKSTFKIAVKHYEKLTVLSNMPIQAKYKIYDSTMIWTAFEKSILMSAQHIAVVITTFKNQIITKDTNVTIWYRSSIQHFAHAKNTMMNIVPYFMKHYSMGLSKLDIVVLPHSQDDNFATFGLLLQSFQRKYEDGVNMMICCLKMFFREADIFFNEKLESVTRKREIAHIIARQLAFLWSYDVLLWSKEGFATFFGAYILDEIFKDDHIMDLMVIQAQQDSFRYDTPSTIISEANSLVLPLNYMKSFIIWRMLYHVIPDVFWTSIREYIDNHTTIPDDLWTTMQTIYQKKFPNRSLHFYLRDIINSWITKKYYPVLNMTRNDNNSTVMINYIQSTYLLANDRTESWIPVTYTTQLSLNHDSLFWLTSQNLRHLIPGVKDSDLVIFNIQQAGYYRVNYDSRTWSNLILYLNSENYTKIHVLNRAQIIDDAFYFLLQRQFDYYMFWNLTSFVLRDMNYVTWYSIFKVFESMSCIFPLRYGDDARERMENIIYQILMEFGYIEISTSYVFSLTTSLKEEVIKWACILNISDCRIMTAEKFKIDLEYAVTSKDLTWKNWICHGLIAANKEIWLRILSKFNATNDDKFLEYLTCFENVAIISDYFKLIIFKDIQLSESMRASVLLSIVEKHARKTEVLSFIFKNIAAIKLSSKWKNDILAILTVIITHVHSGHHTKMVTNFITKFFKYDAQIIEAVQRKVKKRRSEYGRLIENYGRLGSKRHF